MAPSSSNKLTRVARSVRFHTSTPSTASSSGSSTQSMRNTADTPPPPPYPGPDEPAHVTQDAGHDYARICQSRAESLLIAAGSQTLAASLHHSDSLFVCEAAQMYISLITLYPDPFVLFERAGDVIQAEVTRLHMLAKNGEPRPTSAIDPVSLASAKINGIITANTDGPDVPPVTYIALDNESLIQYPIYGCQLLPDNKLTLRVGSVCTLLRSVLSHPNLTAGQYVVVQKLTRDFIFVKALGSHESAALQREDFYFFRPGKRPLYLRRQFALQTPTRKHAYKLQTTASLVHRVLRGESIFPSRQLDDITIVDQPFVSWEEGR
ncbi:hypothetical protein FA95DRAFT_1608988 [Auriscalpium vulgare]|uniref:Uncharacterized protein n=1 Tax=Auriscalpium vulgare TaxID=40419 RepID=A0ACB8RI84_9AGAM|nr:hypothetical protein FA95DRAFT_1608988 [Auriscalpium vulgare]